MKTKLLHLLSCYMKQNLCSMWAVFTMVLKLFHGTLINIKAGSRKINRNQLSSLCGTTPRNSRFLSTSFQWDLCFIQILSPFFSFFFLKLCHLLICLLERNPMILSNVLYLQIFPLAHVSSRKRNEVKLISPSGVNLKLYETKLEEAIDLYKK